ncbi:MAG: GNAT family N-acetyltransferase [Alphaproteobacteria bacterium]|nr:GNAT family N-acetyltransferase [Alphaproteobacteria bacterium]
MSFDPQPTLMGERVIVRPLAPTDWVALYAAAADPLIWEQHPAADRWKEDVFRAFFNDALDLRVTGGGGAFAIIDKATGEVIGSSRYKIVAGDTVEIGWTFLVRKHWGDGTNAELKRLMLAHAFQSFDAVRFRVGFDNIRSRKAVEKLGARLVGEDAPTGHPAHVTYEMKRDDWR